MQKAVMAFLFKLFNQHCKLSITSCFTCLMARKNYSLEGAVAAGGKAVMDLRLL